MTFDPAGVPPDLPPDLLGSIPLFAELQKVLSWTGGPVNWDLARQIAVASAAAAELVHRVDDAVADELAQDARVAEMWLSESTSLQAAPSLAPVRALTPAQWAEHACGAYRELIDPLAAKVSAAIGEQAPSAFQDSPLPPGLDPSTIGRAISQMGPLLLGVQTGGLIGGVAKDLLGEHDLPLPSDDAGAIAIIVPNVDRVAADFSLDVRQTRLWITLHETAHRAIMETLPAVRAAFFSTYLDYVSSLTVDFSTAFERLQGIDLSDPSGSGREPAGGDQGFFDMLDSPGSSDAAGRLEHLIALVEACADRAVEAATAGRLPDGAKIAEAVARHRASTEGPVALKRFIGIGDGGDDGKRRADFFTRAVLAQGGWTALTHMWDDARMVPAQNEISDPESWMRRTAQ